MLNFKIILNLRLSIKTKKRLNSIEKFIIYTLRNIEAIKIVILKILKT